LRSGGIRSVDRREHNVLSVSVVIPTLNARGWLPGIFKALAAQEPHPPAEVVIVESGSRDGTAAFAAAAGARVVPVGRFTHGGARNLGVRESRGEIVAFLSQDACPADPGWLRALLEPFARPEVAGTFSRQVPRPSASPMERFFLAAHFPAGEPVTMRREGGEDLSFQRNVFFSNVSAAVRRAVALEHPFDETLIMSEDQQFARDVLAAGLSVVYAPASVVLHSHDYGLRQVFERYFDSVYSITQIFPGHGHAQSIRMGLSYLRREAAMMVRSHPQRLPHYGAYVLARSLGTLFGHRAQRLPRSWARAMSLHKEYWDHPR
jgi:rhamnosyltransferase